MATSTPLSEPQVLAHTKRRLFPASETRDTYAVVDTQFAREEWHPGQPVPAAVHETLAPYNHVRVGTGYPDLVGVRQLDSEWLAVDRLGDDPPLVAVEAKGYAGGSVDVERGIVQAYDRLGEANAAYVAAPADAVTQTDRALATELNVGVLAVDGGGDVRALERPRVVGNRTTGEASAIRFQATAQGVADKSFGLNHPKNYLAYPLALYHAGETAAVLSERVVEAVEAARTGAAFLGLVEDGAAGLGTASGSADGVSLTPLGAEVVRFALNRYGSVDDALDAFADWHGSPKRFCDLAPEWGLLTRRVVWAYPATQLLVTELQTMHDDGFERPSLVDLVVWLHATHPTFTVELFLRGSEAVRRSVLDDEGGLRRAALTDGDVYHSPTVFQLKAILYHAGLVTERGAEPNRLDPRRDVWRLREPLSK